MKNVKNDSAITFYELCTRQFINDLIDKETYYERLAVLKHIVKRNTTIFKIVQSLLDDCPSSYEIREWYNDSSIEPNKKEFGKSSRPTSSLLLLGKLNLFDKDPYPSIPHIHDGKRKLDVFTGKYEDGSRLSKQELVNLWNDDSFYKKVSENLDRLTRPTTQT